MSSDSTWGIPKPVRTVLAARITELRVGLQEDARRQLAAWGIEADRVGPPPGSRVLSAEDTASRELVLAVLETRRQAGVAREEAFQAYLEEIAFTLLNRLATFRCLEERDLLLVGDRAETLVRRDPVRGASSLVWRTRDENKALDERGVARSAYRAACAAMTDRVRVLFDPTDEASAVFPTLPLWNQAIDAFNDPAIPATVFAEDEIMGWVYQYWSTELKNEVYAKLGKGGKIEDPSELAAATALYTERYIVDYLVQNTLGATWVEMHPGTTLAGTWPYYVTPPAGNPPVEREPKRVRDLTLIDPCVGSGHFLVRAFDLFAQLYAEERIERPEDVAGLILERNLYGADIDRRAVQIAALALYVKGCALAGADFRPRKLNLVACDIAIPPAPPQDFLASLEEPELKELATSLWAGLAGIRTFGSLLHPERAVNEAFAKLKARGKGTLWADDTDWAKKRAHFMTGLRKAFTAAAGDTDLSTRLFGEEASRGLDALQILGRRYDVVVTNPPYQLAGALAADFKTWLARTYGSARRDLYSSFIVRSMDFLLDGGISGLVVRDGWLFGARFAEFRKDTLPHIAIRQLAHLGANAFEEIGGAVVSVAAVTLARVAQVQSHSLRAIKLTAEPDARSKQTLLRQKATQPVGRLVFDRRQMEFMRLPEAPIVYWLPLRSLELLGEGMQLKKTDPAMEGLHSGDDDRFLRLAWEVGSDVDKWVPYSKGGGYARWRGLERYVVNWANGGSEIRSTGRAIIPSAHRYFEVGLVYTDFASGSLGVRWKSSQTVFGDKGPAVMPSSPLPWIAGLLNARGTSFLLRALCPSMQFRTGYVNQVPMPRAPDPILAGSSEAAFGLKADLTRLQPSERVFLGTAVEAREATPAPALLHALEGWNERLVFDAYELGAEDVQAVIDETGVPAGWSPLIAGYDRLPEAPDGIEIPAGLADFLATLEHRQLSPAELAKTKARLRTMYEAGPGAKEEVEAPVAKSEDEEEGAALGARIPIPTETFLEELAVKTELHPITVHWLLEELKAEGVVSPPLRKAELEEYIDITLVRMLGYRWPEQDAYESSPSRRRAPRGR